MVELLPVLLFDGVCNLCNASVDFVIRNEARPMFFFASLQSDFSQNLLKKHEEPTELNSLIVWDGNQFIYASDAALYLAKHLKSPYKYLYHLRWFPRFIRDAVYYFIARNRYSIFGKKESCRIPTEKEKSRFLG